MLVKYLPGMLSSWQDSKVNNMSFYLSVTFRQSHGWLPAAPPSMGLGVSSKWQSDSDRSLAFLSFCDIGNGMSGVSCAPRS